MKASTRIFIVEDDPAYSAVLEHHIKQLGYTEYSSFRKGEDCLEHLDERPQAILLDFSLEGLNGLDTLREIKKRRSRTKVAILTALESKEMKIECLENGASDYILKGEGAIDRIDSFLKTTEKQGISPTIIIAGIIGLIAILSTFYFLFF